MYGLHCHLELFYLKVFVNTQAVHWVGVMAIKLMSCTQYSLLEDSSCIVDYGMQNCLCQCLSCCFLLHLIVTVLLEYFVYEYAMNKSNSQYT